MKLDSKYFDRIRIQSRRRARPSADESVSAGMCQWNGCGRQGTHRAPKGRGHEGEYFLFCVDHVASYNKSYNYFEGMSSGEISEFQKASATGHRPTWTMGVNRQSGGAATAEAADPLEILKTLRGFPRQPPREAQEPRRRVLHRAARNHLAALNLDEHATAEDIRTQFKALAKLHHPDHNGGDRSSEVRFREVLDAYNYLKQAGLC
jgi:curved DNA-binding protein CbpA